MRTLFRTKQQYAEKFLQIIENCSCVNEVKPKHFIEVMENNQGSIGMLSGKGLDEDGLE